MKIYVFVDENDKQIQAVRAANHDIAIAISHLPFDTDFYTYDASEHVEELNAPIAQ